MPKNPKTLAVSPSSEPDPSPPRGLLRSEKTEFMRICRLRRAAGRPVLAIESDLIRDYLRARARLAELQRVQWEQEGQTHFFMRDRLGLAAAVDRAAGVVRRLARDLRLMG